MARNDPPPRRPRWQAHPGTERGDRLPEALAPGYFAPDERSLAALASNAARFAKQIAFFDLRDRPDGTWERWFTHDEALVFAAIADADVKVLRGSQFESMDLATDENVLVRILAAARRLDRWYRLLAVIDRPGAQALAAELRRTIEATLAPELRWALSHVQASDVAERLRDELDAAWGDVSIGGGGGDYSWDRARARSVLFAFLDAIAHLRVAAAARLEASLGAEGHEPSAALFLAFLQLYGRVQARLNGFTERHRDFYHRDVLRFTERPARPDHVHLVLSRTPAYGLEVTVPEGASFALGRELEGGLLRYRLDAPVTVTPAKVLALHTVRLERDRLISPERELRYVTRVKAETLDVGLAPEEAQRTAKYWPLFGGVLRRPGGSTPLDATLGFALASPLLALREGAREIRVRLGFDRGGATDRGVAELAAEFAYVGTRDEHGEMRSATGVLRKVFDRFARLEGRTGDDLDAMARSAALRLAAHRIARDARQVQGASQLALRDQLEHAQRLLVMRSTDPLPRDVRAIVADALQSVAGPGLRMRNEIADEPAALSLWVGGAPIGAYGAAGPWAAISPSVLFNAYRLERVLQAGSEGAFFEAFGELFRRWVLLDDEAVGDRDIQAIKRKLRTVPRRGGVPRGIDRRVGRVSEAPDRADILSCLRGRRRPVREFLVNRVLADLFDVAVTTPAGWTAPTDTFVLAAESGRAGDLTLVIRLRPDAPPVTAYDEAVHRQGWQVTQPCARITLRADSAVFSYSMFADLALTTIHLEVAVTGARDALLHNQLGRLDPSKPFQPFGPLPARGSYLVFGSDELARKPLTELTLNFEWSGLPEDDGGFAAYYRGYTTERNNRSVRIATEILRDGQWAAGGDGTQPLFGRSGEDQRLARTSTLTVDPAALRNHCRPLRAVESDALQYDLAARAGFFRLSLAEPGDPFGNREYPQLLADAVAANARRKRPHPLPNPPYAPAAERMSFDYRAATSLNLAVEIPGERGGSDAQVLLVHPFGHEEVYPAIRGRSRGLVPRFDHDGNLLIGLSPDTPPGLLSLLFHLRDESARRTAAGASRPAIRWAVLAGNRWTPLAADRVLADSTQGFLTSGIVTLDLPDTLDRANTVLPSGCLWLRAGVDSGFEGFAGLYGVHAQAVRATRESPDGVGTLAPRCGCVAEPAVSVPGLARTVQVGDVFDGRPAEAAAELAVRTGERLRHKNRAVTHWDYERLVLERFPSVFKAKCFAEVNRDGAPGAVTVAVVAAPAPGAIDDLRAPKLNAVELERIRAFLAERSSPFAQLVVRNAVYERIQIRCAVRFHRGHQSGSSIQRLNRDISERLSPWHAHGLGARFDWVLRREEVEGWIRDRDYVDSVARVSLLQVAEDDDGRYGLGDSAGLTETPAAASAVGTLRPRSPWSIAIPTRNHAITLMADDRRAEALAAGVADLEVGNTFVIQGAARG